MTKLVARLLATTAALRVRIQTSLKIINEQHMQRSGQHTLASQEKTLQKKLLECSLWLTSTGTVARFKKIHGSSSLGIFSFSIQLFIIS